MERSWSSNFPWHSAKIQVHSIKDFGQNPDNQWYRHSSMPLSMKLIAGLQSGNGDCMLAFEAPARAAFFCILVRGTFGPSNSGRASCQHRSAAQASLCTYGCISSTTISRGTPNRICSTSRMSACRSLCFRSSFHTLHLDSRLRCTTPVAWSCRCGHPLCMLLNTCPMAHA